MSEASDKRKWGRCPRCLCQRPGNDDPRFGLSFAPPCEHCGSNHIPEPEPKLVAWVCPCCMKQYPGPRGHHVAGDDCASACFHAADVDDRGISQPRLVPIEVAPIKRFDAKTLGNP